MIFQNIWFLKYCGRQILVWRNGKIYKNMKPKVIFLIGPPGSGKGTQAELLAKELGFYHFEISKVIEKKFKEADLSDKEIADQKEHWLRGELVHPELVAKWFREEVENLKNRASGFVFSGSARTLEETKQNLTYL